MTEGQLVRIRWEDAETFGDATWQDPDAAMRFAKTKPPIMSTVGHVIYNCHNWVAVTDTIGTEECSAVHLSLIHI